MRGEDITLPPPPPKKIYKLLADKVSKNIAATILATYLGSLMRPRPCLKARRLFRLALVWPVDLVRVEIPRGVAVGFGHAPAIAQPPQIVARRIGALVIEILPTRRHERVQSVQRRAGPEANDPVALAPVASIP